MDAATTIRRKGGHLPRSVLSPPVLKASEGVVVGQGDSYESALEDVKSAIKVHVETFGLDEIRTDPPVLEVFVAEARVAV